jgi:predicted nucleic acid-binding protein
VIVLDASAVVELLLDTAAGRRVAILIEDPAMALHAPHLIDVEVTSVLRRFVRDGDLGDEDARAALEDLVALDLQRHSHEGLLERAWALRKNVTAYDAMYVALAEALDATVITCDSRLSRAAGVAARIELVK